MSNGLAAEPTEPASAVRSTVTASISLASSSLASMTEPAAVIVTWPEVAAIRSIRASPARVTIVTSPPVEARSATCSVSVPRRKLLRPTTPVRSPVRRTVTRFAADPTSTPAWRSRSAASTLIDPPESPKVFTIEPAALRRTVGAVTRPSLRFPSLTAIVAVPPALARLTVRSEIATAWPLIVASAATCRTFRSPTVSAVNSPAAATWMRNGVVAFAATPCPDRSERLPVVVTAASVPEASLSTMAPPASRRTSPPDRTWSTFNWPVVPSATPAPASTAVVPEASMSTSSMIWRVRLTGRERSWTSPPVASMTDPSLVFRATVSFSQREGSAYSSCARSTEPVAPTYWYSP